MHDIETHAKAVIDFYKQLTAGEVDEQVAGVCAIDFNKALLQHETPSLAATPDERREEIKSAAERKAAEREAQLARQSA